MVVAVFVLKPTAHSYMLRIVAIDRFGQRGTMHAFMMKDTTPLPSRGYVYKVTAGSTSSARPPRRRPRVCTTELHACRQSNHGTQEGNGNTGRLALGSPPCCCH